MLVLSRKRGEKILIGDHIVIEIEGIRGDAVRVGITAPKDVRVDREEVRRRIERESPYRAEPALSVSCPACRSGHTVLVVASSRPCWRCMNCGNAWDVTDAR